MGIINFIKKLLGFRNAVDYADLIARGAIIVDVRTEGEYKNGHLKNSVNIPLDRLKNSMSKLDASKTIITVCVSGMRSASAKNILKNNGFVDVFNAGSWSSLKKYG